MELACLTIFIGLLCLSYKHARFSKIISQGFTNIDLWPRGFEVVFCKIYTIGCLRSDFAGTCYWFI